MAYNTNEERLVVKGSERITHDLQVNGDAYFKGNVYVDESIKVDNYDVAAYAVLPEEEYNNLSEDERLKPIFYLTKPSGNLYFQGFGYTPDLLPPQVLAVYVNLFNVGDNIGITTHSLSLNVNDVEANLVNASIYGVKDHGFWNNTIDVAVNTVGDTIVTNAQSLYIYDASNMYYNHRQLTDSFVSNPSLITNAPSGFDPMEHCVNMYKMFDNCVLYNPSQPINIPDSVIDMDFAFENCQEFNQPVNISSGVNRLTRTFFNCFKFNQPVNIPDSVTSMGYTFESCAAFNSPVTIPNSVTSMVGTFSGGTYQYRGCGFNQPITIPDSVTDMQRCFKHSDFNQGIIIPDSVTDLSYCFNGSQFDGNIVIGNNVENMSSCFEASSFNRPITIPDSVTNMSQIFYNCPSFNQPITIGGGVRNLYAAFAHTVLNSTVVLNNGLTSIAGLFQMCNTFNQPINIPNSVTNMYMTFAGYDVYYSDIRSVVDFNQPIEIPENVTDMFGCFELCRFNQNINIPAKVTDVRNLFAGGSNFLNPAPFGASVYFLGDNVTNAVSMFGLTDNNVHKDIYCNNATPFLNTDSQTIVGGSITWTQEGDNYYNNAYNITIHSNWHQQ